MTAPNWQVAAVVVASVALGFTIGRQWRPPCDCPPPRDCVQCEDLVFFYQPGGCEAGTTPVQIVTPAGEVAPPPICLPLPD